MAKLEVIKIENMFMKVDLLIYQQKVKKNRAEQWEFYKAQIIENLNNTLANCRKDKELLQLWLATYAQPFPNFVVPSFVPPSLVRTTSKTRLGTISMGGIEKRIETIMEVDSIATKVATKNTQAVPDTTEAIIKTVHPSTLSTITKIEKSIENLQLGDNTGVVPMVE